MSQTYAFLVFFGVIIALLILPYIGLIMILHRGLNKPVPVKPDASPAVSVLIPFRNERNKLGDLLKDLTGQPWQPADEIVFIDDHSDDAGRLWLDSALDGMMGFPARILSAEGQGKKAALQTGINWAANDVILTLDADVRLHDGWLGVMRRPFGDPAIQMTCGAVIVEGGADLLSRMETLDMLSLVAAGRALTAQKLDVMCNGANLGFRKTAFARVGGYGGNERLPSGDDTFLLHKMMKRFPEGVYVPPPSALGAVVVRPQPSWSALRNQRLRWAGKSTAYKSIAARVTALIVGLVCLVVVLGILFGPLVDERLFYGALALWAMKIALDMSFLYRATRLYQVKWNVGEALLQSLLYPFYTSYFAVMAPFLKYEWKGRQASSRDFR